MRHMTAHVAARQEALMGTPTRVVCSIQLLNYSPELGPHDKLLKFN